MSHEIADHDEAGGDADAHLQLVPGARLQRPDDAGDFQSRPDRPLGIVLVGVRKAEIGENAVAHEFGDETVIARDHARAGVLIGADHLPHILGIEPRRQRGRAREVAEHDRQLAALSRIFRRGTRKACRSRRLVRAAQICNRLEDSLSGSQRQAELFEIGLRQFRQNVGLDFVLAKRALILSKPEVG